MSERINRVMAALSQHQSAPLHKGDPLALPLISATTYHLPDLDGAPFMYARMNTPTWQAVEDYVSLMEEAEVCAFPSGMAAISAALFATVTAGDVLIVPSDGYYVTRALAKEFLAQLGVIVVELPTCEFAQCDFHGAAAVCLETPSNPGLDLVDIADVAQRCAAAGARLIVDNTMMSALLQQPLDLGADLVVVADTKAPGGHSDALLGHVAGRDSALMGRVRDWRRMSGATPGALEAWLVHRGLQTLELRLARMCESALYLAQKLSKHRAVRAVRYPGLMNDPSYDLACQQMESFGFLIGIELRDAATAEAFLSECTVLRQSTSFGGTHSCGERRARWGDAVPEGFVRISVGVEPQEVLWQSIETALQKLSP